ncbi:Flo11p, partial [Saccharomyces eubayanus]|uniref:Flo11p n=1 Tax=Saccharomyces eubayanus TaxID=1080349 RepID=UPI0006C14B72
MQRPIILAYLVLSLLFNSALGYPTGLVPRGSSEGTNCNSIVNGCPSLDFNWHMNQQNIMQYTLDVTSVSWVQDNTYQIQIHVKGKENIDLKYLWSLKVIGITGPQGTVQLYGVNEKTYIIDNPTDFTATFEVYATQGVNSCEVWMPNFQIQFDYLQGNAAQYASTWKWGTTSFDLSTGCNNYDNQGHSQTDFPGFYWNIDCDNNCGGSKPSTTKCTKNHTPESSTSSPSTTSTTTSSTESSSTPAATPSTETSTSTTSSTSTTCTDKKPTTKNHNTTPCTKHKKSTTSPTTPCTTTTTSTSSVETSSTPAPTPSTSSVETSSTPCTTPTTASSSVETPYTPVPLSPSSSSVETSSTPASSSSVETSSTPASSS